jgi:hypothetical protein
MILIDLPNPFGCSRPWGLLSLKEKLLLEGEKLCFSGVEKRPARKLENIPAICETIV